MTSPVFAVDEVLRLENVQGRASIQMPVGFLPAEEGFIVHVGQQILVRPNSSLIIRSSESSCFFNLRKPGVFVVPKLEECTSGHVAVFDGSFQVTPVSVGAQAVSQSSTSTPKIAAGAFVLATFGTALWATSRQNHVSVTLP